MKTWIRNHPVGAFLVALYPLMWLLSLPALLGTEGVGVIPVAIPPDPGLLAITIFGLAGLSFLITYIVDGKAGVRQLLRRFYTFPKGPQWYLLAVFLSPAMLFLVSLAMHGGSALTPFRNHASEIFTVYLLNLVIVAALISLSEECGWMAFVTSRLQRRWGPVAASVAVGPLIGFIHFPLIFISGGVTYGKPEGVQILEYMVFLLFLLTVPVRILITWLYNSTGGSLVLVALLHQSFDVIGSPVILNTFFGGINGLWLYAGIIVVAIALVVVTRGRLGYRGEQVQSPPQSVPAVAGA